MKAFIVACLILVAAATGSIAQERAEEPADEKKELGGERIGIRVGWTGTSSDLDNIFGDGLRLALHFNQRIINQFGIDFSLGAFYLGSTARSDITESFFVIPPDNVSLRVLTITAAPMLTLPLNEKTEFYFAGGTGLYTIGLIVDSGFLEGEITDNHLGINASSGLMRRVSQNWYLEVNAEIHKVWTSSKTNSVFFVYSEGDKNPVFFDLSVGVLLNLF